MNVTQETLDLIKRWEGCRLKAYKCSAGKWTVGYGLTTAAGFITVDKDTTLTQAEAEWYLEQVVAKFADQIAPMITAPITPPQFGAFVSLVYNIGPTAFRKSSALRHFNAGDLDKVPAAMKLWKKAGGKVVQGLVNRREDEVNFFLSGPKTAPMPKPAPKPAPQQHWLLGLLRVILSLFSSPWRPK